MNPFEYFKELRRKYAFINRHIDPDYKPSKYERTLGEMLHITFHKGRKRKSLNEKKHI